MEEWVYFGLLAAVSFAIAGLAAKVALNKDYMGLDVRTAAVLTALGVSAVFIAFYFLSGGVKAVSLSPTAAAAGIAIGLFWALGQILIFTALLRGADAARMAPIYNMNTLLVVVFGIILLHEIPDKTQTLRVVVGAILIVAGGILVGG